MNFVEMIMKSIAGNFGKREGIELDLSSTGIDDITININDTEIPFNLHISSLIIDEFGDADLKIHIPKEVIMEKLLDEEDMINCLKNNGYKVVEEES